MSKFRFVGVCLVWIMLAAFVASQAQAEVIVDYSGGDNPTLGDWTAVPGGSGGSPITPGFFPEDTPPYMQIADTAGRSLFYRYIPTAEQHAAAAEDGWKMTALVRVPVLDGSPSSFSVMFQYLSNTGRQYTLEWGSSSEGEAIVRVNNDNFLYTVAGSTIDDFVLYELIYNPDTSNADLYVNGSLVIEDIGYSNGNAANNRVIFGAGSSAGVGTGDYAIVRLEVIPEPSSMMLIGAGSLLCLMRRRRK